MRRVRIVIFLTLLSAVFLSFKADTRSYILRLDIKVMDEETEKGLPDAIVDVYADDELIKSNTADINGVITKFEIPCHRVYKIFIKKDLYVTKLVEIDARTEDIKRPMELSVLRMQPTLFKVEPGIDLTFLDTTALVKYKFDNDGIMQFDQKYTAGVLEKVNAIREGK